jgi:hypothetical protein
MRRGPCFPDSSLARTVSGICLASNVMVTADNYSLLIPPLRNLLMEWHSSGRNPS